MNAVSEQKLKPTLVYIDLMEGSIAEVLISFELLHSQMKRKALSGGLRQRSEAGCIALEG